MWTSNVIGIRIAFDVWTIHAIQQQTIPKLQLTITTTKPSSVKDMHRFFCFFICFDVVNAFYQFMESLYIE